MTALGRSGFEQAFTPILRRWQEPASGIDNALNLAVFRVTVPGLMLASAEPWQASAWARLAPGLRVAPEGLRYAAAHVPIDPGWARIAQVVLMAACAAGMAGLFSRSAMTLATLAGLYVFGLPQLAGSVTHNMHLLWFSALLAVSPCGDALSLDRWLARRRGVPAAPSTLAHAAPLHAARLLLGIAYFFPGFWKLRASGTEWIFSDNLRNQMYWKWYEAGGWTPTLRIDQWPTLLRAGALAAVAFELSFIALVLVPRLRPVALVAGLGFHAFTKVFMLIPFSSLWGCYTLLVDWSRWFPRHPSGAPATIRPRPRAWPAIVLGATLVAANAVQGARGAMQAWPFACYPTFQWTVGSDIPDLLVEAVRRDGSVVVVPDGPSGGGRRSQQRWAMVWQVAGFYRTPPTETRLRAYTALLMRDARARAAAHGAESLRFYAARYSVVPENFGAPATKRKFIGKVDLPDAASAR